MQLQFSLTSEKEQEPRYIALTNGGFALVDAWNYDWLNQWPWQRHPRGYVSRHKSTLARDKTILMHRFIMGINDHRSIDHIDGDRTNNQEANLRFATQSLNNGNARKQAKPATSQYKGVYWFKARSKWYARITYLGKTTCIGLFLDETDAARAYDAKARELFGEFARPNFP